ncbi:MAG: metallophosphoesterase family protein [Pseudomonadales bacterium]|nr:metallophosphoesterase family protein [Pseudomonadales bacterium]
MTELGIVADTHDLVRPELLDALAGVDAILHAGDVCRAATLAALEALAPVTAVRGNNDREPLAAALPEARAVQVEDVVLWLCHDAADLERLPPPAAASVVVVGHSHRPVLRETPGYLLLNPGSPGRRRFSLPVSCARMTVDGDRFDARLLELAVAPPKRRPRRGGRER